MVVTLRHFLSSLRKKGYMVVTLRMRKFCQSNPGYIVGTWWVTFDMVVTLRNFLSSLCKTTLTLGTWWVHGFTLRLRKFS